MKEKQVNESRADIIKRIDANTKKIPKKTSEELKLLAQDLGKECSTICRNLGKDYWDKVYSILPGYEGLLIGGIMQRLWHKANDDFFAQCVQNVTEELGLFLCGYSQLTEEEKERARALVKGC